MSEHHRMLLTELAAVRMPEADVTRLYRAYVSHVEHTRRAYMDYCNDLQNAVYMCHHLHRCAPLFALHVQVLYRTDFTDTELLNGFLFSFSINLLVWFVQ